MSQLLKVQDVTLQDFFGETQLIPNGLHLYYGLTIISATTSGNIVLSHHGKSMIKATWY